MALIIRMPHKFCYHQWLTVWIGRDALSAVCLLCRERIVDRSVECDRIPPTGATNMVQMRENSGDRPETATRMKRPELGAELRGKPMEGEARTARPVSLERRSDGSTQGMKRC